MKSTKKFLSFFIAVCCLMGCLIVPSSAYTIQNNGHDGIYINIESAPYKTLAQVPTWGQYAYETSGCAWFASARARELTGKNIQTIWSGQSWYNSAYSSYGFSRGSAIKAKALACYANHVSVVERVNGNNVIISEGGYTKGSASAGYCVIRSTTVSAIQAGNSLTGKFLGYVYLGVNDVSTYTVSYNANGGTGAPASQTKTHGKTLTLSSTIPTRTGYTFLGWSTSSTATTATYSAGGSFTANANTKLYAVWKVNEVTGTCGENLTWTLNEATGVLTISGTGDMDNYYSTQQPWYNYQAKIKNVIINNGVSSIGSNAFSDCTNLTSIAIPDSVISIGYSAFSDCINLVNISLSDNVTYLGSNAFYKTGYYNNESNWENGVLYIDNYLIDSDNTIVTGDYTVKEGTTVIAGCAFWFCENITSIAIPDSVVTIGDRAFCGCDGLTSFTIPKSVINFAPSALEECKSIVNITVDGNNLCYSNDEYGVLFNKDKTELIKYPTGNTRTSYTIPGSVLTIGSSAFSYCSNLTSITIPDSVTTIGNSAFSRCSNLTSIAIPDGVTTIENSAFFCCSSLTNVTIPDGVTTIENSAFWNCKNLTDITIPDSVTTIENSAFGYCKNLTDITIPKNTTIIEDYAFDFCKGLKNVTMSANIIEVGVAFEGCSGIENVYYIGTEEQWNKISFWSNATGSNHYLTNANIHYCEEITEKPATCEQVGYTAGLYCTDCEDYVVGHEIIPALEHTYNSVVIEPTCTDAGYTTYTCVCGDTFTSNTVSPTGHNYENGICINCGRTDTTTPSEPENPDTSYAFSIKEPSTTTIRHNDSIILHINVDGELPEGSSIEWSVNNDNFDGGYTEDGMQCLITSKNNGYTTVVATLYDANDNVLATDSIEMRSKAGFFDKIGGFFRSLFGTTKIYEY